MPLKPTKRKLCTRIDVRVEVNYNRAIFSGGSEVHSASYLLCTLIEKVVNNPFLQVVFFFGWSKELPQLVQFHPCRHLITLPLIMHMLLRFKLRDAHTLMNILETTQTQRASNLRILCKEFVLCKNLVSQTLHALQHQDLTRQWVINWEGELSIYETRHHCVKIPQKNKQ